MPADGWPRFVFSSLLLSQHDLVKPERFDSRQSAVGLYSYINFSNK